MIELPGHFFDMVGFRTADDVVHLADCLSSKETLDKYQISVLYDVVSYLSWLKDTGKLDVIFENNLLLWVRKS